MKLVNIVIKHFQAGAHIFTKARLQLIHRFRKGEKKMICPEEKPASDHDEGTRSDFT